MIDSIEVLAALAALTISPEDRVAPGVPPQFTGEMIATTANGGRWAPPDHELMEVLQVLYQEDLVNYHGEFDRSDEHRWPREDGRWSITTSGIFKVLCR